MTPDEASLLLVQIVSLDTRWSTNDETLGIQRVRSWASVLVAVPLPFAREFVTRYYGRPDMPQITPAAILTAWRNTQRVETAREHEPALIGDWFPGRAPEGFREFVETTAVAWRELRATHPPNSHAFHQAAEELRARIDAAPLPWARGVRVDDTRERRCRHHDICICTHTECRDGWLDATDAATRCHVCFEAVEMRSELRPKRGARR